MLWVVVYQNTPNRSGEKTMDDNYGSVQYQIFLYEGKFVVRQMNYYEKNSDYTGVAIGERLREESRAEKFAYVLNHVDDKLAFLYLTELIRES